MRRHLGILIVCIGSLSASPAATIVVDPSGGGDYTEIQPAVDAAESGDVVVVRAGEYVLSAAITIPSRAITLRSEEGAERTILRAHGISCNEPVAGSRLEGFTITGAGMGLRTENGYDEPWPIVSRLILEGNTYGVICSQASPRFFDCAIRDSLEHGVDSSSSWPLFVRCTISGTLKTSQWGGNAIYGDYGTVTLVDCGVTGNAGLAALLDEGGSVDLLRCRVSENGGGILCTVWAGAHLESSIVSRNAGTGVACVAESGASLVNCTVEGNAGAGIETANDCVATVKNCIVWNDTIETVGEPPPIQISYSIVEGDEPPPGEGNSNADPLFVGPDDFHLQAGSPAIDAGTADGAPATDIEGLLRPCGIGVDLGAYEAGGCLPEAENALGDPPDPIVEGDRAIAYAATLTAPAVDEGWSLRGVAFRNVGRGDASRLLGTGQLYADDGDGEWTESDEPMGSAAAFDSETQTLRLEDLDRDMAAGGDLSYFLVCELADGAPDGAGAATLGPFSAPTSGRYAPLLAAAAGLCLILALRSGGVRPARAAACVLIACASVVASVSGCGGGDGAAPASREIQVELLELRISGAPGLEAEIDGLPSTAWTFEA